ncbi:ankyrin [Hyaloscypha bicolor E]|uniref:Ankyrin n=1 Tax=Hyaloscypha bicolor E TaxID=1095630 RepID=A0A2J6T2Q3_9HELO|nr:ankyrin [Hyaloscypha bicolor E]PMD57213.1 ankyrin [Hyaloscypha bicolor E]
MAESSEKSSTAQTASMHQRDSFKEPSVESREKEVNFEGAEKEADRFSRTLPEIVPIRWTKNNSLPTHAARVGVQNTTFHPSPGIYEIDTSITTSASDAEARSLATALEPKKRMFSVKGLRHNILQQNLENSDQVASGFLLQTLAQVLEDAASAGNLPLVASALDLGADVNYSSRKNKECHLALPRAAAVKHEPVVEYLLRMGANRDTAASALYAAINHKATGIAMKLVPRADFNKMWKSTRFKDLPHNVYESPVAALVGMDEESRRKILRLMMEQPSFDAESPAMSFVENIDELSSPKSSGMTVLGCFAAFTDLATVEFLLQQLGQTNNVQKRPNTSQYRDSLCCISSTYWQREPADALKMASLLLDHGAHAGATVSIPGQRKNEYSALTPAIKGGSLDGVRLLLKHGTNPESSMYVAENYPHDHLSPLSYAVFCGAVGICRALVESGAVPNRVNVDEAAVESNNLEIVGVLIHVHGASATPQVWERAMLVKHTPKEQSSSIEIIDLLLSTKTKSNPFRRAWILAAIDSKNFSGLHRVLEMRNKNLGFDVNEVFQDPRWSNVSNTVKSSTLLPRSGFAIKRDDLYNCLAYAEEKDASDIVALLKSYWWTSKKRCGPDSEARFGSRYGCSSKPPHTRRGERLPMDEKEVMQVRAGR